MSISSLEMVKGRPIPDRITNPDEVLFDGESKWMLRHQYNFKKINNAQSL